MNTYNLPVYTEFAECQDCYKCVRECPVKAIKIENYHASIIPELCIHCGHCVEVCPVEAKQVRNDLSRVKAWLNLKSKIAISLAPSWQTEFPVVTAEQMISALKACGFTFVSETALGAQEVNANLIEYLKTSSAKLHISTACPTAVKLVQQKFPDFSAYLTPFTSPLLAHAKLLRQKLEKSTKIIFIGPCFGKKDEADKNPELVDAVIDFSDLVQLFTEMKITPENLESSRETYFLGKAREGSIYPVDGGILSGIKDNCAFVNQTFTSISGIKNIESSLKKLNPKKLSHPIFLEIMACEGGCINGPGTIRKVSYLQKRMELIEKNQENLCPTQRNPELEISSNFLVKAEPYIFPDEKKIEETFRSIGKYTLKDQLNCGGCGYNSCREFVEAIIAEKAEPGMCVSFLRKRAQKKANALFRTIPSGVIIVNKELRVVESNRNFFKILHLDDLCFGDDQGFEGAYLEKLIPFSNLFDQVLQTGQEILDKEYHHGQSILKISIFTIEPYQLVGGIVQDTTVPSVAREQTIKKARDVINKNLDMVQKIAYLLGENAAEVEMTLNSIIDVSTPNQLPVEASK